MINIGTDRWMDGWEGSAEPEPLEKSTGRSRKSRHSSDDDDRRAESRRFRDDYQDYVGLRYWGDEEPQKRQGPRREGRSRPQRQRRRDRNGRDGRDNHGARDTRGGRDARDTRDAREAKDTDEAKEDEKELVVEHKRRNADAQLVTSKTGSAYIPPAKLKLMQARRSWSRRRPFSDWLGRCSKSSSTALSTRRTSPTSGLSPTSGVPVPRERGARLRPTGAFHHPGAGGVPDLHQRLRRPGGHHQLLTRLILQFRRGYVKQICLSSTQFITHFINQQIAHELLLLENATDDLVEMAIGFPKESGQKLGEVSPCGLTAIFDQLRHVLHEPELDKRVKYMIEVMYLKSEALQSSKPLARRLSKAVCLHASSSFSYTSLSID